MDFTLTQEQQMLDEAVRRFVEKEYVQSGQDDSDQEPGYPLSRWQALADMGLLGLLVPPAHGGLGKDMTDVFVVMRALGQGLIREPYIGTALVAASMVARGGTDAQKSAWLLGIAEGSLTFALATEDYDRTPGPSGLEMRDGRLYGHKSAVLCGDSADWLIVPVSSRSPDDTGTRVFCIDARAPDVSHVRYTNIDGQRSAEITFDGVPVDAANELCSGGHPASLLEWGLDIGRMALCAEAVGALETLLQQTLEHLATRQQFGQNLGRFQVLQHRAVDMMVSVELAHSVALMAAAGIESGDDDTRRRYVSTCKAQMGRYIRHVCEQAIQTFGGMGMTREFEPTRYVRRLLAISMTWGNTEFHIDRYSEHMQ